ncbi:MAG: hypothetical protein NT011_08695 [Kiritimatiellaeota bacterium]|nr:hypothetical protein [Kiritimatiellota bacterium]
MLSTQNTQTKTLLQSRAGELQTLYERMDEMQRKIMNASPPEVPPAKETLAPSAKEAQASPTIEAKATDSLIVTTTNAVTLRLPIPTP